MLEGGAEVDHVSKMMPDVRTKWIYDTASEVLPIMYMNRNWCGSQLDSSVVWNK